MAKSKIEWTDAVWNPVTGCSKVSQGCKHCYAETIANRFWGERKFTDVQCHMDRLDQPLHWKKPRKVFVNSMSDLFHPSVPLDFVLRVWMVMAQAKQHTFQILTKRADRMELFVNDWLPGAWGLATMSLQLLTVPLPNVWLGVSVENQATADVRMTFLLRTPAAKRFVSCEPLLGPVELFDVDGKAARSMDHDSLLWPADLIHWVIAGGESGPGCRPMNLEWARDLLCQCRDADVPFFFKQLGGYPDKRHDPTGWPEDLRIQEFPR